MFPHDPDRPESATVPGWLPALFAALLLITISGLTTWLTLRFDAFGPGVGDMIVFPPASPDGNSWQLRINATTARRGAGGTATVSCLLDPNVISLQGGSLVIEAREEADPPRFHLHWAGRRTAAGKEDCGGAADLVLDRYDLQRLANAAGGFGTRPTALR